MISSMDSSLARLSGILEEELRLVRKLRPVMERKQQALVKSDLPVMEGIAEEEIRISSRLTALELDRMAVTAEVASCISRDEENISLSELIRRMEPTAVMLRMDTVAEELRMEIEILREIGLDNQMLAQNLVDYTGMVMRLLGQGMGSGQYNQSGRYNQNSAAAATVLDGRV